MSKVVSKCVVCLIILIGGTFYTPPSVFSQTLNSSLEKIDIVSFPEDDKIRIILAPDARTSKCLGTGEVETKGRGNARIKVSIKKLPSILKLSGMYSTFLVWKVSPNGLVERLIELKADMRKEVDREFKEDISQTSFGLIVTAEPHELVRMPSRMVILKMEIPFGVFGQKVSASSVQAKFNESDYFRQSKTIPTGKALKELQKKPLTLLGAENAVTLAGYAEAEQFATESLNEAQASLDEVKGEWLRNVKEEIIEAKAKRTISLAAKAENEALENKVKAIGDIRIKTNAVKVSDLENKLENCENNSKSLTDQLNKVRSDLTTAISQLDRKDFEFRKIQNENENFNGKEKKNQEAIEKLNVENQELKIQNSKLKNKLAYIDELPTLNNFLQVFGKVRKEENKLILTLNETIWNKPELTELTDEAITKLLILCEKLKAKNYLQIDVFSQTSAGNNPETAQDFAEKRAAAIFNLLKSEGIEESRISKEALISNEVVKITKTNKTQPLNKLELTIKLIE